MTRKTQNGKAFPSDESIRMIAGGDFSVDALAAAFAFLTQDTRTRVAGRMVSDYADLARYVVSDDWSHYLSDDVPEFDTRWVFDRRRWTLAVLHVKRRSATDWLEGLPDEIANMNESLVDVNANALDLGLEMDDFGVRESDAMPEWASEASMIERHSFVQILP